MLGVVSVPEPVRVVLEIQRTRRTISGQVAVDGAQASGFYGWLELIDELERASDLTTRGEGNDPLRDEREQ
jgi:hypothetical protein